MTSSTCAFCTHENPARAKYCNECASPLALKPCRACDAVNAKTATACHRCRAAFPPIVLSSDVSTETIVAQADETLEELRRELAEATARAARFVPDDRARAPVTPTGPIESDVSQAPSPVLDRIAVEEKNGVALPRGDHFIKLDEAAAAATVPPPDRPLDSLRVGGDADTVVLRGRRTSPVVAIVVIVMLLALPVGIYAWRNPAQLQEWVDKVAALLPAQQAEAPQTEPPPAASPTVPAPTNEASVATDAATDAGTSRPPNDARAIDPPAGEPVARPADSVSPTVAAPAVDAPVEAAPAPPVPAAKSASTSRSRASNTKSQSRAKDRTTRPRSSPSTAGTRRPSPPVESVEPD